MALGLTQPLTEMSTRNVFWGIMVAGRIMSMKNSNDTIGNRSRDHPVYSAEPQPLRHRNTVL
jgi:hypothetical protein